MLTGACTLTTDEAAAFRAILAGSFGERKDAELGVHARLETFRNDPILSIDEGDKATLVSSKYPQNMVTLNPKP